MKKTKISISRKKSEFQFFEKMKNFLQTSKILLFQAKHPACSTDGEGTLREETFANRKICEIFAFRGIKLLRIRLFEKFRGNKLSRE